MAVLAIHRPKSATIASSTAILSVTGVTYSDTVAYDEPVQEADQDEPTGHVHGGLSELTVSIMINDPLTDQAKIIGQTGNLTVVARGSCGNDDRTYVFANTCAWKLAGSVTVDRGETVFRYTGRYYSTAGTVHPRSVT